MTDNFDVFGGREIVVTALVGSHNYNLNTPSSDEDYKYFVAPNFDDLWAGKRFSTAKQTDTFDYDCHDIRQLSELLWKANLNFVEILFSRRLTYSNELEWIFKNAHALSTMNLPAFKGCVMGMHYEKMAHLLDGTAKTDILVSRFGYDTKQACHAMRCLYVLERVAGGMSVENALWFETDSYFQKRLLEIKAGELTEAEFRELVQDWHLTFGADVAAWFAQTKANESLKVELDQIVKNFVRSRV